jgi:hypothetical protein
MSLDVTLNVKYHVSYDNCGTWEEKEDEVFWKNITHNLSTMAKHADLHEACWSPYEIGNKAGDILPYLKKGLEKLKAKPKYFKQYNAKNGWGLYEHLVSFVEEYIEACEKYPDAIISISV